MKRFPVIAAAAAVGSIVCLAAPAVADINGFGNFSGFSINQADAASPPTVSIAAGSINLTNSGSNESRSIFFNSPQPINSFTASFTYQANNVGYNFDAVQGIAFVLQSSASGASVLGNSHGLGYGGVSPSLGVTFELIDQNSSETDTELCKNGSIPLSSANLNPINAYSGDPLNITISYGGALIHEGIVDTVTHASWATDYVLSPSLSSLLGSSTAYVGITAGTVSGVNQTVSNFQFATSAVPEPTMLSLIGIGGILILRRRR